MGICANSSEPATTSDSGASKEPLENPSELPYSFRWRSRQGKPSSPSTLSIALSRCPVEELDNFGHGAVWVSIYISSDVADLLAQD